MRRKLRKELRAYETPTAAMARYHWQLLSVIWTIVILCAMLPGDALLHHFMPGLHLPAIANGFAVICTALIFGSWPAFAVAVAIPFVHNWAAIPPLYSFDTPSLDEYALAGFYLVFALVTPALRRRADKARKWNDSFASGCASCSIGTKAQIARKTAMTPYHLSQAYYLASELDLTKPEDCKLIVEALRDIIETGIETGTETAASGAPNVLPFVTH